MTESSKKRFIFPFYLIPIAGKWEKLDNKKIELLAQSDPEAYAEIDDLIYRYQQNPLSFSLLHGNPNAEDGNDSNACINDYEHDLILLTAPNQTGKSTAGAIYTALRLVPTEPDWPCFKEHGLKWKEWAGPQIAICASYTWDKVNDLWSAYKKVLPRSELKTYAPLYGYFPGEKGNEKDLSFTNFRGKELKLKCGSKIIFLCYKQSLSQWTGKQADIAHLDEQCPELYFDELLERQRTRGDFTPIIMTLTGHIVPDRPDTGANGWIHRKLINKNMTKGRKYIHRKISIEDVPDEIYSKDKKAAAKFQHVTEPNAKQDERALRAAVARYWGGFEVGGGKIFSEWNPEFHFINQFDYKKYKPTYYRMIDHGEDPCAAAVFAVMPWGDAVMIKEYYEFGKNIDQNSQGILEMCGNTRRKTHSEFVGNNQWEVYDEITGGMEFRSSELDCRSFAQKSGETGRLLGSIYNNAGLKCTRADGRHDDALFPILKEWLSINKERKHIYEEIGIPVPKEIQGFGAPRLYVFNTCSNFKNEIETYIGTDENDHLLSVAKFFTARDRPYLGDWREYKEQFNDNFSEPQTSNITGY